MYSNEFKKNEYLYLIVKKISPNFYLVEECIHSFDTAARFLRLYGNSKYLILKVKLKEVIH